jgi:hypothetical protein
MSAKSAYSLFTAAMAAAAAMSVGSALGLVGVLVAAVPGCRLVGAGDGSDPEQPATKSSNQHSPPTSTNELRRHRCPRHIRQTYPITRIARKDPVDMSGR